MVLVGAGLDKKLLDFAFFETSGQKRSDACDELATVEGICLAVWIAQAALA